MGNGAETQAKRAEFTRFSRARAARENSAEGCGSAGKTRVPAQKRRSAGGFSRFRGGRGRTGGKSLKTRRVLRVFPQFARRSCGFSAVCRAGQKNGRFAAPAAVGEVVPPAGGEGDYSALRRGVTFRSREKSPKARQRENPFDRVFPLESLSSADQREGPGPPLWNPSREGSVPRSGAARSIPRLRAAGRYSALRRGVTFRSREKSPKARQRENPFDGVFPLESLSSDDQREGRGPPLWNPSRGTGEFRSPGAGDFFGRRKSHQKAA